MERYNFLKNVKLWKACEDEDTFRPVLHDIFFDGDNAVASNGHIMAIAPLIEICNLQPLDIGKLNGKLLNSMSYKKIVSYDFISEIDDDGITCTKDFETAKFLFDKSGSKYPNYKDLIPDKSLELDRISFKPISLMNLCEALGGKDNAVILDFYGASKGIKVTFSDSNKHGLLMPCYIY